MSTNNSTNNQKIDANGTNNTTNNQKVGTNSSLSSNPYSDLFHSIFNWSSPIPNRTDLTFGNVGANLRVILANPRTCGNERRTVVFAFTNPFEITQNKFAILVQRAIHREPVTQKFSRKAEKEIVLSHIHTVAQRLETKPMIVFLEGNDLVRGALDWNKPDLFEDGSPNTQKVRISKSALFSFLRKSTSGMSTDHSAVDAVKTRIPHLAPFVTGCVGTPVVITGKAQDYPFVDRTTKTELAKSPLVVKFSTVKANL